MAVNVLVLMLGDTRVYTFSDWIYVMLNKPVLVGLLWLCVRRIHKLVLLVLSTALELH